MGMIDHFRVDHLIISIIPSFNDTGVIVLSIFGGCQSINQSINQSIILYDIDINIEWNISYKMIMSIILYDIDINIEWNTSISYKWLCQLFYMILT